LVKVTYAKHILTIVRIAGALSISFQGARAQTVTGPVEVIDGDTFHFASGLKVRLYGLDTLEKNQRCQVGPTCVPCGQQTKAEAISIVGKHDVTCKLTGEKSYDREVGTCTVEGKDYTAAIISAGWGIAYRQYLPKKGKGHEYVLAEERAKAASVGIWSMTFIPPADWRNHKMRLQCERR